MLYKKRSFFVTVAFLFLGVVFLFLIVSKDAISINEQQNVTDMQTSYPSYQSSLTYADYAGLTEPIVHTEYPSYPSYQSSLTYPDYAGLTEFTLPTPLSPLN